MMKLEVDGKPFDTFKELNVSRSMEELTGQFSFVASAADASAFPIRRGAKARITVNETAILTGWVEVISPNYSDTAHDLRIQGRGKLGDLLDSTLSAGSLEVTPPVTLTDVINRVLQAINLKTGVISNVPESELTPYTQEEIVSCKAGDGAFSVLEQYARKRQVLISEDGDGNVTISRASGIRGDFSFINLPANSANTVLGATATYNDTERFNKYIVGSQANLSGMNNYGEQDLEQIVSLESEPVYDTDIRASRVLYLVAENASNPEQNKKRAQWEANIRKARSKTYSPDVEGITIPGTRIPFQVNRLAQVRDHFCNINAIMLIKSFAMNVSVNGSKTSFELVDKDAYTLKVSEPKLEQASNEIGESL